MRAVIYTRISLDATGERHGVTRQREDCLKRAADLGWDVVREYDDNDISAYSGKKRPAFEGMLADMAAGHFDALICWHPDRLYRSPKDLERIIDVTEAHNILIRTVNGGDYDLTTSTGRMQARIAGVVARQESEHKGERQRRANQQRRAAGKWNRAGRRPFGYTKDGVPHPDEAPVLRIAASDVLAGKSLRSIAIDWNRRELFTTLGNKWTNLGVKRALLSPLYTALVEYEGEVVGQGEWEPLWDEDTHKGLVALLTDPRRTVAVAFERKHMGSGVYKCGVCGGPMYTHNPNSNRLVYACRPSSHVARSAYPVDQYVTLSLLKRLEDVKAARAHRGAQPENDVDVIALEAKRSALHAREAEADAAFTEGDIDRRRWTATIKRLQEKRKELDAQIGQAISHDPVAELLAVKDFGARWNELSPDQRGKVIDRAMTVTVNKGTKGERNFRPDLIHIKFKGLLSET